jgi:hypothetical protein
MLRYPFGDLKERDILSNARRLHRENAEMQNFFVGPKRLSIIYVLTAL